MSEINNSEITPSDENFDPTSSEAAAVEKFAKSNPDKLPPQFNGDPDKFIKSWKDMRAEVTRLQQAAKAPQQEEPETAEPSAPLDALKVPDKPVQPDTTVWDNVGKEIVSTGEISQQTREALTQKFGIPSSVVDDYVDAVRHKQKAAANEAAKVVGGEAELQGILAWARDKLSDQERAAINQSLASAGWQNVLLGLKARRDMDNPVKGEPRQVNGQSKPQAGIVPFSNKREMTAHFRDPRYGTDPAFTQLVQDRIRITGVIKNDQ
jgi:hypothetical protein